MNRLFFTLLFLAITLTAGCKSPTDQVGASNPVTWELDIYRTDQGFFVITERRSGDSMAVRFNTEETHKVNHKPQEDDEP